MEATLTLRQEKHLEDYLRLDEGTPIQLIAGEFIMSPSPRYSHQRVSMRLSAQLYNLASIDNLGEVCAAPIDVFVGPHDVYQPDVLFVSNEHLHYMEEDGVHGPPDIVIEILSKKTAGFDLLLKKDKYEEFGVPEYWIVDPMHLTVECFRNSESGYESTFSGKSGKVCSLVLPDFCIEVEALFAR
jgi:Uma2 family endonuclease